MVKKTKSTKAPLVVQSKVKDLIRKNRCNTSSDVIQALTSLVETTVNQACTRAKANKRKTVRGADF